MDVMIIDPEDEVFAFVFSYRYCLAPSFTSIGGYNYVGKSMHFL
jgi:hypothetical protein